MSDTAQRVGAMALSDARAREPRMHPAIAALTPQQADAFVGSPYFTAWLVERGIPFDHSLFSDLVERSTDPKEYAAAPRGRTDSDELRELMEKAGRLPRRVQEVASLCLEHGFTLRQCAERLGISRETVRVHLRRLRAMHRMVVARRAAHAGANAGTETETETETAAETETETETETEAEAEALGDEGYRRNVAQAWP